MSKILEALRLSGALWDRGPALRPACPRTCCACQRRVRLRLLAFLREPFKHIKDQPASQIRPGCLPFKSPHSAKISNINRRKTRLSHSGSQEFPPGYCNSLFSEGIPTGVSGAFASPDPTNQHHNLLPTSLNGQACRPPGGSTAQSATFQE